MLLPSEIKYSGGRGFVSRVSRGSPRGSGTKAANRTVEHRTEKKSPPQAATHSPVRQAPNARGGRVGGGCDRGHVGKAAASDDDGEDEGSDKDELDDKTDSEDEFVVVDRRGKGRGRKGAGAGNSGAQPQKAQVPGRGGANKRAGQGGQGRGGGQGGGHASNLKRPRGGGGPRRGQH